jgi:hypothetical protein
LHDHWKEVYSNLLVLHIQPVSPALPCAAIHVDPAENGKGTSETVAMLISLQRSLETEFGFRVVGLAFDGDSAFSGLHNQFMSVWQQVVGQSPLAIPRFPDTPVIIDC